MRRCPTSAPPSRSFRLRCRLKRRRFRWNFRGPRDLIRRIRRPRPNLLRRAEEAGLSLEPYPHFRAWIARIEAQPGFLATMHPYAIDPHSVKELP